MGMYVKLGCVVGLVISVYALWVEHQVHNKSNYLALCDLHQYASCSRVLTSKYARGFGVIGALLGVDHPLNMPNCLYGIVFFLIYLTLDTLRQSVTTIKLKFYMSVSSLLMSLYLGYILAFVLFDLCVVCISTYIVNIGLAIPAISNYLNTDTGISHKVPQIWFMEDMSTLTPYNVALVLLVNHYCNEPPRSKLAVVLLDCIKYRNMSLNQLIDVLNNADDSDLGSEFMDYLDKVFKSSSLAVIKRLVGNRGSAQCLMSEPDQFIKPTSLFGLFLRHIILSFELASFEELSCFLQELKTYIEDKDTVYPVLSSKQQEARFCREVDKFENSLSLEYSHVQIHEMCSSGSDKKIQQAEFLQYLNFLSVKEYNLAKKHLHQYFTMMLTSGEESKNIRPFSALCLAAMHTVFNHKTLAMQYLKESIHLGQLLGEESCLSHCIAWTSYLQGTPITRPNVNLDLHDNPAHLEVLNHIHNLETMCKEGDDTTAVLKYMSDISPLISTTHYHTNATEIFRRYDNSLLYELHPFFALFQLCPDWLPDGHMISFSSSATGMCIALCNLALAQPHPTGVEVLNVALRVFPKTSSLYELILLTLNKIQYMAKSRTGECRDTESAMIRTISESTHVSLTSCFHDNTTPQGDVYISEQEVKAAVMYNSAQADLPNAPSQALDKLLSLILYCRKYKLQSFLIKAQLLMTETQITLKLFSQALHTIESVFVVAMASSDTLVQSSARWLYVQAKMATALPNDRLDTFRKLQRHLQNAQDGFMALNYRKYVCDVLYYTARLYDEFGMKEERNVCAKNFRKFHSRQYCIGDLEVMAGDMS